MKWKSGGKVSAYWEKATSSNSCLRENVPLLTASIIKNISNAVTIIYYTIHLK